MDPQSRRDTERHYKTMSYYELEALPVAIWRRRRVPLFLHVGTVRGADDRPIKRGASSIRLALSRLGEI